MKQNKKKGYQDVNILSVGLTQDSKIFILILASMLSLFFLSSIVPAIVLYKIFAAVVLTACIFMVLKSPIQIQK